MSRVGGSDSVGSSRGNARFQRSDNSEQRLSQAEKREARNVRRDERRNRFGRGDNGQNQGGAAGAGASPPPVVSSPPPVASSPPPASGVGGTQASSATKPADLQSLAEKYVEQYATNAQKTLTADQKKNLVQEVYTFYSQPSRAGRLEKIIV